jgi:hypothetical protein
VYDGNVVDYVHSWENAIASCASIEWENKTLEGSNSIRNSVSNRAMEEYRKWNEITDDLKTVTVDFSNHKFKLLNVDGHLPKVVHDCLRWDILGYGQELEYAEFDPPGFYGNLMVWYQMGHFPCGWNEETQKLIVY